MIMIDLDALGPVLMMLTAIVTVSGVVLTSHRGLSKRVDRVEANLTGGMAKLEQRFAGLEQKFTVLEQKFAGMEQKFTVLEQKLAKLSRELTRLDEEFASARSLAAQNEASTAARFAGIEASIARFDERLETWGQILIPMVVSGSRRSEAESAGISAA